MAGNCLAFLLLDMFDMVNNRRTQCPIYNVVVTVVVVLCFNLPQKGFLQICMGPLAGDAWVVVVVNR